MSSYTIRYSDSFGKPTIVIDQSKIDYTTTLGLPGPSAPGYGEVVSRNFLRLLENFANASPPENPTEGQLWYDTSNIDDKKLKIFDNATWYPINGIHQQAIEPTNVKKGDIWVDTVSLQLKICSSPGNWVTVGADFSLGLQTGAENVTITGTDGIEHPVIISYLNGDVVTILAKESFRPIVIIEGFDNLIPGLNLSTKLFDNVSPKVSGQSTEATSLRVTVPVSQAVPANFFLRKDIPQSLTESLVIDNNTGLRIGATSSTFLLQKIGNDAVITSISPGSKITLNTSDTTGLTQTLLTVEGGSKRVGIGLFPNGAPNINPSATLDVAGTLRVSEASTLSSTLTVSGLVRALGNLSVAGSATVTGVSTFTNTIFSRSIIPTGGTDELGSPDKMFKNIWVESIASTSTQFNGNAASASRLSNPKQLTLSGHLTAVNPPNFDGVSNVNLVGTVNYKSIDEQTSTSTVGSSFSLAVTNGSSLFKVTKSNFLSDVTPGLASSGMIMAWAGGVVPSGWVLCDGTTYNQSGIYNSLFGVIGTTYGSTAPGTFQVPNIPSLTATGPISVRYIIKV